MICTAYSKLIFKILKIIAHDLYTLVQNNIKILKITKHDLYMLIQN